MTRSPDTLARYLKGIGPKRAKNLGKLGINSIEDILYYFPRRYEDRTNFTPIAGLKEGEVQTVSAKVLASSGRRSYYRRGLSIIEATVADGSGKLFCVWFNQPYLKGYLKAGTRLILYGKTERYSGRLQMSAPEFEIVSEDDDGSLDIGRITPVYSLPKGISQRYFRKVVKQALDEYLPGIKDFLSYGIRSKHSLLNAAKALFNIHFPEGPEIQRESYRRLSFEEFFIFQVPLALRKLRRKEKQGIAHRVDSGVTEAFFDSLPFVLTEAQKRAFTEIKKDMGSREPMQRLLQGDVGSGKTIVALASTLIAVGGGYQTAFMVPTEILAKQHFETVTRQIQKIRVLLLTSSLDRKAKEKAYLQIREGRSDLVIGTHALLEEGLNFKNLGLVVIDEQHKFGVGQRALLPRKGVNPDCLIMTATPIPRTLAITLYGDLDISVIDELPKGRIPVETTHFKEEDNAGAYGIARQELAKGHQVYCVYPVIEDSYALDIVGAEKMYEELEKKEFRDYRVGLIHGRLKQEDQDKAMQRFKDRE
ncbi:MAG: ATP-dependent DNA helicase RecG, partial [Candidatus Omnitrophica bacterium]|nr:ATP-dependent DNA helicase RecG [Candidatus Omnitrophota bacterium]